MATMKTIRARHAVRAYKDDAIKPDALKRLRTVVDEAARESGLNIQLVENNPEAFNILARFGVVRGARQYVALVVREDTPDEAIGYWGQKIVLEAQDLGLNTCWCALCSRKKSRAKVGEGEKIRLVIAVGYGKTQGEARKTKGFDELAAVEGGLPAPAWFKTAVEAAQLAPTAMNHQNFKLTLRPDGRTVRAEAPEGGFNLVDLGIVKRHVEVAAAECNADFEWEK
ncbi:MAG: nitroreductase family protein [Eggerthellaceae bacterium]|nr:nitroreductase family protein [Eggerthellaceae bacterium]